MHAKEHRTAGKRNNTRSDGSCVALGNGELGGINLDSLSPMQAYELLRAWKEKLK